jgi:hypothetical protein
MNYLTANSPRQRNVLGSVLDASSRLHTILFCVDELSRSVRKISE